VKTTRLCISLGVVLLMLGACAGGGGSSSSPGTPTPVRVTFTGGGDLGIFDPSVTRDPGDGKLWMSYSSVQTSPSYSSSVYWAVSIRLASSSDNGVTWQDEGLLADKAETTFGTMTVPEGDITAGDNGIWQSETSSLIYDPSAIAGEEWKLIWFQYMHANSTSYFASYSWISMKTAATPTGLVGATAVKLFGGAGLAGDNNNTATPLFSPIGTFPAFQLNTGVTSAAVGATLTDLNLCIFAEPGLHATAGAVYLAIFCADASTIPATGSITEYLEYFKCASPCTMTSAASWEYLGRLLTPADAQAATGDNHYQAPALVEKNGKTYLIVTPVDTAVGNRYNGCRVYQFTSVDAIQLVRNAGNLVEIARVDGDVGTHNGACAGHENMTDGILLSEFDPATTPEIFRIYQSNIKIP
jgi:hypothetical protein